MELLDNVIQEYAWGSRTAIAELLRRPSPTEKPQAELWLGAHPNAPSRLPNGSTLLDRIRESPDVTLGTAAHQTFGARLPFLLKVLAAQTPLSLQAHPSLEQAREGFARENAAGIPLLAAHRNYKDDNHKPELICALSPFDALCGFRPVSETIALFRALNAPALDKAIWALENQAPAVGLSQVLSGWLELTREEAKPVLDEVLGACARSPIGGPFDGACRWAVRLGAQYPGDIGAVCSLLLNCVTLQPYEALYLPAGNLHAYLQGTGIELMANSDNVLRGGLTPKHVDVGELKRVLDFRPSPVSILKAIPQQDSPEQIYLSSAAEFRLSHWTLTKVTGGVKPTRWGPEIVLCTQGNVHLRSAGQSLPLQRGESAFIAAGEPDYTVEGDGELFRATLGTG